MQAKGTLRVNLTKLRLQGDGPKRGYLAISTTDYNELNPEERKLAQRFYGQGKAFVTAMNTLKQAGINKTKVYVLSPDYVSQAAVTGPVGRTSWRYDFSNDANSSANGCSVSNLSGVRVVRRVVVPAGDAPKITGVLGAASEIEFNNLDKILTFSRDYVAPRMWAEYEAGIRQRCTPK